MPDVPTQTWLTGNRIEAVWNEHGALGQAKYQRTYNNKKRATKRIVDQVGKRMAEHIVEAVQKTVRQARKKAQAPADPYLLPAIEDKVDVMGCDVNSISLSQTHLW